MEAVNQHLTTPTTKHTAAATQVQCHSRRWHSSTGAHDTTFITHDSSPDGEGVHHHTSFTHLANRSIDTDDLYDPVAKVLIHGVQETLLAAPPAAAPLQRTTAPHTAPCGPYVSSKEWATHSDLTTLYTTLPLVGRQHRTNLRLQHSLLEELPFWTPQH